jgi:hypothetical protein
MERALIVALVCARHLGRYTWEGTLNTGDIMTASTWDCFPQPPGEAPAAVTAAGQAERHQVALTRTRHDHH